MTPDLHQIRERLISLEVEHRDMDTAIALLIEAPRSDDLQLRRFKKRKLQLKDQILQLQMQLVPDIPA
jgi:hypothetical protein